MFVVGVVVDVIDCLSFVEEAFSVAGVKKVMGIFSIAVVFIGVEALVGFFDQFSVTSIPVIILVVAKIAEGMWVMVVLGRVKNVSFVTEVFVVIDVEAEVVFVDLVLEVLVVKIAVFVRNKEVLGIADHVSVVEEYAAVFGVEAVSGILENFSIVVLALGVCIKFIAGVSE